MYAYFVSTQRRRTQFWQEEVLGMPLMRVELPQHLRNRKCTSILRCFERYRVHEVLNTPVHWPGVRLPPLKPTRSLWISFAAEAALCLLKHNGISPSRATVEFYAQRYTPQVVQTLQELLPRVRGISLSLPDGDGLCWQLQREFGVSPTTGPGDLSLCFAPAQRRLCLPLWARQPEIPGLSLRAPIPDLPPDCPSLPLLCALEEQGRIPKEQIQICSDFS